MFVVSEWNWEDNSTRLEHAAWIRAAPEWFYHRTSNTWGEIYSFYLTTLSLKMEDIRYCCTDTVWLFRAPTEQRGLKSDSMSKRHTHIFIHGKCVCIHFRWKPDFCSGPVFTEPPSCVYSGNKVWELRFNLDD